MKSVLANIWNHPSTSIAGVLIAIVSIAGVLSQQGITLGNAGTGTIVTLVASIAAALLGLLSKGFTSPSSGSSSSSSAGGATGAAMLLICLFFSCTLAAQTTTPAAPTAPSASVAASTNGVQNLYAAGLSYNVGGSPALAGTGLYAHQLPTNSGTYAFTAVDVLPNTVKPFTVTTNIGAGIAQKLFSIGSVPIYVPTAAGISISGPNTGWQWDTGALASIHVKGNWYLLPSARVVKSSVANGTGYQPILGVLLSWAQ